MGYHITDTKIAEYESGIADSTVFQVMVKSLVIVRSNTGYDNSWDIVVVRQEIYDLGYNDSHSDIESVHPIVVPERSST